MNYIYKKDQFLRNKISGNIVQLRQDTNTLDLNIWKVWVPIVGELCWFWNAGDKYPTLSRLVQIYDYEESYIDGYEESYIYDYEESYIDGYEAETSWSYRGDEFDNYNMIASYDYKFCAPVTNILPLDLGKI